MCDLQETHTIEKKYREEPPPAAVLWTDFDKNGPAMSSFVLWTSSVRYARGPEDVPAPVCFAAHAVHNNDASRSNDFVCSFFKIVACWIQLNQD